MDPTYGDLLACNYKGDLKRQFLNPGIVSLNECLIEEQDSPRKTHLWPGEMTGVGTDPASKKNRHPERGLQHSGNHNHVFA